MIRQSPNKDFVGTIGYGGANDPQRCRIQQRRRGGVHRRRECGIVIVRTLHLDLTTSQHIDPIELETGSGDFHRFVFEEGESSFAVDVHADDGIVLDILASMGGSVGVGTWIEHDGIPNGIPKKVMHILLGKVGDVPHVETTSVSSLLGLHRRSPSSCRAIPLSTGVQTDIGTSRTRGRSSQMTLFQRRAGLVLRQLFGGGLNVE
mmetsp:Transcript_29845/g.54167  ORF Transcript_29845/g.54167 Transcript_29845/m.54167 type:complete len:205 (-) Transcript_29845:136-750(-)